MAMPETRIGFFPDVGATGWLFQKCGRDYPEFLGLTGYELQGAECVRAGLADCLIPSAHFDQALDLLKDLKACSDQDNLCEGIFARLSERSPLAVVTTLQCLRRDEHKDLAEVYESDLTIARFLMTQHDFREGVRARLIDKDDHPRWGPESFEEAARVLNIQTNGD